MKVQVAEYKAMYLYLSESPRHCGCSCLGRMGKASRFRLVLHSQLGLGLIHGTPIIQLNEEKNDES